LKGRTVGLRPSEIDGDGDNQADGDPHSRVDGLVPVANKNRRRVEFSRKNDCCGKRREEERAEGKRPRRTGEQSQLKLWRDQSKGERTCSSYTWLSKASKSR
jgi:hypothetical protein